MECCAVGTITEKECHLDTYSNKKLFYKFEDLTSDEKVLLSFRINNLPTRKPEKFICQHHKCEYLDYFDRRFKKCCDPFKKHTKTSTLNLRSIDIPMAADSVKYLGKSLVPGDKLCRYCFTEVNNNIKSVLDDQQSSQVRYFL